MSEAGKKQFIASLYGALTVASIAGAEAFSASEAAPEWLPALLVFCAANYTAIAISAAVGAVRASQPQSPTCSSCAPR